MECLFFLSFSSSILLACYDGTCYLDETLYGWNNVYVQLAMYEWMELYMYARWNLCAGYVICLLLNSPVKYIYICHIFAVKIAGFKKTEKEAPLPSAADGKGTFPVCRGWQRSHAAATCAPWELTHLVSLPTAADGKGFAYSGRRQRMPTFAYNSRRQRLVPQWRPVDVIRRTAKAGCSLPSAADGKGCR